MKSTKRSMKPFDSAADAVVKPTSPGASVIEGSSSKIYFARIDQHKMLEYLRPEVDLQLPRSRQRYLFASVYKKIMALNVEQQKNINAQEFTKLLKIGNGLFG